VVAVEDRTPDRHHLVNPQRGREHRHKDRTYLGL